jgi:hypothetical protein
VSTILLLKTVANKTLTNEYQYEANKKEWEEQKQTKKEET